MNARQTVTTYGRALAGQLEALVPLAELRRTLKLHAASWVVALGLRFGELHAKAERVLVDEATRVLLGRDSIPPPTGARSSGGPS